MNTQILTTEKMFVRIKHNAYVNADMSANKMRSWLKANEGNLIEIETDYLFDNQYNTVSFVDADGQLNCGYRLYDTMISEVINDARKGMGKCNYCGKMLHAGETCTKYVKECLEHGIKWFTPENTFFLKYPQGVKMIKKEILSIHEPCIKIGTYYFEAFPSLDYYRIYNGKQTINFKYADGFFYVKSIGWNRTKHLPIPSKIEPKLIKILTDLTNSL